MHLAGSLAGFNFDDITLIILRVLELSYHTQYYFPDGSRSYPWDYWPMEDVRSVSGYVGLQNLGATCYMATCMQHLYMIPQARQCILRENVRVCCKVINDVDSTLNMSHFFC